MFVEDREEAYPGYTIRTSIEMEIAPWLPKLSSSTMHERESKTAVSVFTEE
jgi:hypothetical protein